MLEKLTGIFIVIATILFISEIVKIFEKEDNNSDVIAAMGWGSAILWAIMSLF